MTLDDLAARCKGGVTVTINDHKCIYMSAADFIAAPDVDWFDEVSDELRARMIAEDKIVQIQFYPETPVGFYFAHGTTVDEALAAAEKVIRERGGAR
jgi:hypothetical protein